MFGIGPMEIAVVFILLLLIFGPRQLPKLGRSLGETCREFRNLQRKMEEDDNNENSSPRDQ